MSCRTIPTPIFAKSLKALAKRYRSIKSDIEAFISKEELQSIQKGLDDIKNGRTRKMLENESLTDFLKRTETCMKYYFQMKRQRNF